MSWGAELIRLERLRQQQSEGHTAERDAGYVDCELILAAHAYLVAARAAQDPNRFTQATITPSGVTESMSSFVPGNGTPTVWPWPEGSWKPSEDPVRNLVKAGALIAAEIDRLRVRP